MITNPDGRGSAPPIDDPHAPYPAPGRGTSRCAPGAVSGTAPVGRGQPGARSAIFRSDNRFLLIRPFKPIPNIPPALSGGFWGVPNWRVLTRPLRRFSLNPGGEDPEHTIPTAAIDCASKMPSHAESW